MLTFEEIGTKLDKIERRLEDILAELQKIQRIEVRQTENPNVHVNWEPVITTGPVQYRDAWGHWLPPGVVPDNAVTATTAQVKAEEEMDGQDD